MCLLARKATPILACVHVMMALDIDEDLESLKLKPLQLAGKELWLISLPFEVNHSTYR